MSKGSGGTRSSSANRGGYKKSGLNKSSYEQMYRGRPSKILGENVIDIAGRKIVMMDFGGQKVPFYLSTGLGGKDNVPSGKWYPFFGFAKNGWFIKASGQEDYYGDDRFKAAAQYLDNKFGDRRYDNSFGKKIDTRSSEHQKFMDAINDHVNPKRLSQLAFMKEGGDQGVWKLAIEPNKKKVKLKKK